MIRFYCHNRSCQIETYKAHDIADAECPCCKEKPDETAEEYEREMQHEAEIARYEDEEHRRMYGCPYEDMQEMNYRPQLITNEDGEPIGWG